MMQDQSSVRDRPRPASQGLNSKCTVSELLVARGQITLVSHKSITILIDQICSMASINQWRLLKRNMAFYRFIVTRIEWWSWVT
jgi:hypothetical protein